MEKKTRFLNCKKIIAPEEPNFYSVEFLNGEFNVLNLAPFAYILSIPVGIYICGSGSILGIRIRIHEAPENGSNTDPDPQHWLKYTIIILLYSTPGYPDNKRLQVFIAHWYVA